MSAALLLIPFLLIRFGLLSALDKGAVKRAAYFAPMEKGELAAYWIYQLSNMVIFIYLFFLKVGSGGVFFMPGIILYIAGMILLIMAVVNFAAPSEGGINKNGLYRISRNPMYLAYFVYFLSFVLLSESVILFAAVLVFQISSHWIILAEERWCTEEFGAEYLEYMSKVRRYI